MLSKKLIILLFFLVLLVLTVLLVRAYQLQSRVIVPPNPLTILDNYRTVIADPKNLVPGMTVYAAYIGPVELIDYKIVGEGENQETTFKFRLKIDSDKTFIIKQVPCTVGDRMVFPIEKVLDKRKLYMVPVLGNVATSNVAEMLGSEKCKSVWSNLEITDQLKVKEFFVTKSKFGLPSLVPKDFSDTLVSLGIVEYDPK